MKRGAIRGAAAAGLLSLISMIGAARDRAARLEIDLARSDLALVPREADVWDWHVDLRTELEHVEGKTDGRAPLLACRMRSTAGVVEADRTEQSWVAKVRLRPGLNQVTAECRDATGKIHQSDAGRYMAMLPPRPEAHVEVRTSRALLELDATKSSPSAGSRAPLVSYRWWRLDELGETFIGEGPVLRVPTPQGRAARTTAFRLVVRDSGGATDTSQVPFAPGADPEGGHGGAKPCIRDAVVYGVVPPLFGVPPLESVRAAVPKLAELGINALWLSPIFATLPKDYGYAVRDYFEIRGDYGTERDLSALVEDSHRYGVRVLLDLVPNHTSQEHPYFADAAERGADSHYYRFYERDAGGQSAHYFDWSHLPNLDYNSREVRNFMLAVGSHWIRTGIDGYRIDAAWGVRERAADFWAVFGAAVRRVEPDAWLIAEASARDPFYGQEGFDAAYDWTDEPGAWAWEHAFEEPDEIADRIDAAVGAAQSRPFRFLNNNDTGPRFVTRHGVGMTRVATAALLTLPGIPSLFTGDERGAEYEPYQRREPLSAEDPHHFFAWHKDLIALRRSVQALREDGYTRVTVDGDRRTLAYLRHDGAGRALALVVLRFDARPIRARIPLPPLADGVATWKEPMTGRAIRGRRALTIDLDGWSARVLVADGKNPSTSDDICAWPGGRPNDSR